MEAPVVTPGLVDGEAAGDAAGLPEAAGLGLGDAGGLTSGVHADVATNAVARIIPNPKFHIPNRNGLLIIFVFICVLVRAI